MAICGGLRSLAHNYIVRGSRQHSGDANTGVLKIGCTLRSNRLDPVVDWFSETSRNRPFGGIAVALTLVLGRGPE